MFTQNESESGRRAPALFLFEHTPLRLFCGVQTSTLKTSIVTSEMANALKAAGMKERSQKEREQKREKGDRKRTINVSADIYETLMLRFTKPFMIFKQKETDRQNDRQ